MSPSVPPSSESPRIGATTAPRLPASTIASLIFGALSLLLLGAFFFDLYVERLLPGWFYVGSVVCGVIGAVFGHRARAHRAAPGSRNAALAVTGLVLSYGGVILSLGFVALVLLALTLAPPPLMN